MLVACSEGRRPRGGDPGPAASHALFNESAGAHQKYESYRRLSIHFADGHLMRPLALRCLTVCGESAFTASAGKFA